jgi:hypothetical protein
LIFWFHVTGIRAALVLYCLLAIVQIRQKPGLQYDEALPVMGAVHLRHQPHQEFSLPHDPGTWIHVRSRWFPLMTVRYVGAIKEYIAVPLFAMFGPRTSLIRMLSVLLGLLGIWGIAGLLRLTLGARVAAATALAIAINPSYVAMTAFDNGTVSIFMASLALLCLAIAAYLRHSTNLAAFAIGLAVGFGVWARVNFAWLAIALLAATILVLRRRLLKIPPAHWILAACGAVAGCLPLIVYQFVSHGGTFEALGMFSAQDTLGQRLYTRMVMFSESLLCDREHRAMWSGPFMPWFERWLFPIAVLGSCAVCLVVKNAAKPAARILAIAFLLFGATLFSSGLMVSEHHLVALLPFAAAMTAVACFAAIERWPRARCGIIAFAVVYAVCAFLWQTAAVAGLKKTGGVGVWSDGVVALATRLEANYAKSDIKFLDWGFQQNIYTITDGRLPTREIFGDATAERSGLNRPWMEELRDGGLFVMFAPGLQQIPAATTAFQAALQEYGPVTHRFSVSQRDGAPYAEAIEVEPNTLSQRKGARISTANPRYGDRLEGFHEIEEGRWRWSKRNFAITFDAPAEAAARLNLEIYVPDSVVKLGPVKLTAQMGGHTLPPETYRAPGSFVYARDIPEGWLKPGPVRVEFALDKALTVDDRELGLVVVSAALE